MNIQSLQWYINNVINKCTCYHLVHMRSMIIKAMLVLCSLFIAHCKNFISEKLMPVIPMLFGMNCISNVGKNSEIACDVQMLFQTYFLHYMCDKSHVLISANISGTLTKHVTIEYDLHLPLSFY